MCRSAVNFPRDLKCLRGKVLKDDCCYHILKLRGISLHWKLLLSDVNKLINIFIIFVIKFRYNARSDWLKERALSEYRARSDEGGPISVFALAF